MRSKARRHTCAPLSPTSPGYRGEQNRKEEVEDEKALPGAVSGLCTGYHETTESPVASRFFTGLDGPNENNNGNYYGKR